MIHVLCSPQQAIVHIATSAEQLEPGPKKSLNMNEYDARFPPPKRKKSKTKSKTKTAKTNGDNLQLQLEMRSKIAELTASVKKIPGKQNQRARKKLNRRLSKQQAQLEQAEAEAQQMKSATPREPAPPAESKARMPAPPPATAAPRSDLKNKEFFLCSMAFFKARSQILLSRGAPGILRKAVRFSQ